MQSTAQEFNTERKERKQDFPGGAVDKNPLANQGDTGSIPGLGRSHNFVAFLKAAKPIHYNS